MRGVSIEIALTAHDEEATIGSTVGDFLAAADRHGLDVEVLVAEDGSSDRTREVVAEVAECSGGRVRLTPRAERKGYSLAVTDAYLLARREVVVCCDGDGQYVPDDLPRLLAALAPGTIVAGARSPRQDPRPRLVASWAFGCVYRLLSSVRMKDPSSPFVVAFRNDVMQFLPASPVLPQGFWWEFFARADAAGLRIVEVPVAHRRREGPTRVYRLSRIPRIALVHVVGLVRMRRELKRGSPENVSPAPPATAVEPR
jgi:glycosyltransferase involved in cell wall biosynthesis